MSNGALKRLARAVLGFQGILVGAAALAAGLVFHPWGGLSAALGGLAGVAGQGVLLLFLTKEVPEGSKAFVQRFFLAEALKLLTAGGAFAGVLLLGFWAPGALIGFCTAVMGALLGPRVLERRASGHVS